MKHPTHARRAGLGGVALLAALLAGCAGGPPKPPREPGTATLAGAGLSAARGAPVLVLQSGLGEDRRTWKDLLPALSAEFTVYAHDRPGAGENPAVDGPRDPCTLAAEQRARLRAAGLPPPYLLVGHSLGGLYQYAYASLYPEDVAGFVLIDPTHPRNWAEVQQALPATATALKGIKAVAFNAMEKREFDDQSVCLDRPEFARPPGRPGVVLSAGRPMPGDPEDYEALRHALAREWPALAGVDGLDVVWDSAHFIHQERPQRVLAAIRRIAAPQACADGCPPPERGLTVSGMGARAPLAIAYGQTRRADVEAVFGEPRKTYADFSASGGLGGEVRVYHDKPPETPMAVGFIPILGDLLEAVDAAQNLREWRELIVEYDAAGVVRRAGLRVMR